jgi:predicted dehydrogenase
LEAFVQDANREEMPVLLTGYNRRFSPHARAMSELLASRSGPFMIDYRMNAGYISQDHWVHGPEGGGRNLGEACHVYDLFGFLSAAEFESVSAHAIAPRSGPYGRTDNFVACLTMSDGSVATLTYTAMGSSDYAKETADLYVDGTLAFLDDYRTLRIFGGKGRPVNTPNQDKGHKNELSRFAACIRAGEWPIPWEQQIQTARLALAINEELLAGK